MNARWLGNGLLCLLLSTGCGVSNSSGGIAGTVAQASAQQAFPEAVQARLLQAVTQTQAAFKVPGVIVSVSAPGQGLWETSLGVEDKATGRPMVAGMHTRIGSITKTFTVTALLMLADDKRLGLDDPIGKYLDFVPNGNNITLRQLASMTSGLYSYTQDATWVAGLYQNPTRGYTVRELLDVGFRREPRFPPGTNINYCNSNTLLLGLVIEQVSGLKVEDFFAQRIYPRLGLRNTVWPTDNTLPQPFAHGYTEQTPNQQEADATFHNPSWGGAAGQLISNLDDLKVWARALGEGTLLSPEMQKERLTWVPFGTPTFGYGLGIGLFNGWLGHTGELPGYNTGVYYLPSNGAVVVIQTNSDIALILPGGPGPVELNPVPAMFREIAKVITPANIPDGTEFLPGQSDGADL